MTGTEVTLEEIISETGGIKEVSSDTHFYIENLVGEGETADVAQVTSGANIFKYVQSQMPKIHILTKFIIISGTTDTFNVDLIPYIYYTKIHLKFPPARNFANITINITGLKDRKVPLESITMSGLDEDTDFLPIAKRGTITFTLDTKDYAFPEKIYHFGGFATGEEFRYSVNAGSLKYIFLHIEYIQAMEENAMDEIAGELLPKYAMTDAIFGTLEVWNLNTSNEDKVPYPYLDNSTLILKMNAISNNYINTKSTDIYIEFYIDIINLETDESIITPYFLTHMSSSRIMPIVVGTNFLQKDSTIHNTTIARINVADSIGSDAIYMRFLGSYTASARLDGQYYIQYGEILGIMGNPKFFKDDITPTDVAMFQVAVFGKYLQKQI